MACLLCSGAGCAECEGYSPVHKFEPPLGALAAAQAAPATEPPTAGQALAAEARERLSDDRDAALRMARRFADEAAERRQRAKTAPFGQGRIAELYRQADELDRCAKWAKALAAADRALLLKGEG